VAHAVVAEPDTDGGRARVLGRQRQVAVAVDVFAARAVDLEVDVVDVVGAQDVARAARQQRDHLAFDFAHLLRQHRDAVFERMVERLVGDRLGDQVGDRDAHRPEQQQRRQHPVEDFAEQRMLDVLVRFRIGRLVQRPARLKAGGRCGRSRVAPLHLDS
jgi:hypothetical protein